MAATTVTALLVALLASSVSAQDISAITAQLPPGFQIADILPNDATAQAVYQQMLASNSAALQIPVRPLVNGAPSTAGYDPGANPDCWWTANPGTCRTSKHGSGTDVFTCPEASTYGLSIDDGPTQSGQQLYQFFASQNQRASLYYIGSTLIANPQAGITGFTSGHEICVHTWSHHYTTTLTTSQVFAELYYTRLAIKKIIGVTPLCWRPPYGDVDDRVRFIATFLGMSTHLWSADTLDWQGGPTIDQNYANIIAQYGHNPQGGVIVLSHEVNDNTVGELIKQYPAIKSAFDQIMPVHACQNITSPYAEPALANAYPNYAQYVQGQRPTPSLLQANANTSADAQPVNAAAVSASAVSSAITTSASASAARRSQSAALSGSGASATPSTSVKPNGAISQRAALQTVASVAALTFLATTPLLA